MSLLLPVNINGVSYQVHAEYTSDQVSQEYQRSLGVFVGIFNLRLNEVGGGSAAISDLDAYPAFASDLEKALNGGTLSGGTTVVGLLNLASDGMLVTNDPVLQPGQKYLTVEMASALDQLIRSLKAVGVPIVDTGGVLTLAPGSVTTNMVKNWRNLAASSAEIQKIINLSVAGVTDQNRTLQALVELIYVKTGNDILAQSLEGLESALSSTKASLNILTSLQELHNKLTAEEKVKFKDAYKFIYAQPTATGFVRGDPTNVGFLHTFLADGTPYIVTYHATGDSGDQHIGLTTAQNVYTSFPVPGTPKKDAGIIKAADIYFASIDPQIQGSITQGDRTNFLSLRNQLIEQVHILSGTTPVPQEGTLVDKLRKVLETIHKAFSAQGSGSDQTASGVSKALFRWILDNYTSTSTSFAGSDGQPGTVISGNQAAKIKGLGIGEIQRSITAAVTAGQSVNDTQKEEVRRYLFVFEEYYKSATSILQKITQILERMAQSISR